MATDALGIGGAETHIVTLSRALSEMGHSVTVLSRGGIYETALSEYGIRHITVPYKRLLFQPRVSRFLAHVLSLGDYDIVHAHTRKTAFLFHRILKGRALPLVTTAHWTFSTVLWKRIFTRWGRKTLAVSEDIRDYLIRHYAVKGEDIRVTVNGIDGERFRRSGAPFRPYDIVTVTRLDTGRSRTAWALLSVLPRLAKRFPAVTLTVVGDGNEYRELRKRADAVNAALGRNAVRTVGASDNVLPYLDGASVFVGASRAALEALSAGCVALLSGDEGYLSLFDEATAEKAVRTNFCFRGEATLSEDKLYSDIVSALSLSKEERERLSMLGREFVMREYSVERMARDALSVYHKAIEGARPKVLLSGYYGYGNLGDDLSLSAAVRLLKARGVKGFFIPMPVLVRKKERDLAFIPRYSPLHLYVYMKRSDRLVFGGGTLLQNATSRRSLFYYTFLSRLAKACGVPTEILAGGIGQIKGGQKKGVKRLLSESKVSLRTPRDIADARRICPKGDFHLLPDLVFSLPFFCKEKRRSGICVSLRGSELPSSLLRCLRRFKKESGEPLCFVAMSPRDISVCRRAAEETGGEYCRFEEADGLLTLLSSSRYAIGMRLHFLILALMSGCCPVSLSYDEKGEKIADFVNDTLQSDLVLKVNPKSDDDLLLLYRTLHSPSPAASVTEVARLLSAYYGKEKSETF